MVTRKPRLLGVVVRTLLITFLFTLLSFAVTLLLAIIALSVSGMVLGHRPDMTSAYRYIALPMALVVAAVVLIAAFMKELRRYRVRLIAWRGF